MTDGAIDATEDAIRAAVPAAIVDRLAPDLHRPDHPDLVPPARSPNVHR